MKKQVVYTVKLTTDTPTDIVQITDALAKLGTAEVTNYVVKSVKA
jgi:hypothetical protein